MISPRLVAFALLAAAFPVFAEQDAPPPNVDSLASELTSIETKQKQTKAAAKSTILGQIQAASANGQLASAFYAQAIEEVKFRGRKDKVTALIDWKKANGDLLRSKDLQSALLFHLRYLAMALQRKDIAKPETLLPATMAYINDLAKDYPEDTQNLLGQAIGQGVIAQWLKLNDWLPDSKVWEPQPGNIAGILEKNVRPILRDLKSPQLLQTWDLQLKLEAEGATKAHLEYQSDAFNTVARPRLIFQRSQDMIILGQPNRAVGEIIAIVKAYPEHPDFPTWTAKIRELIKRPATPTGTSPQ